MSNPEFVYTTYIKSTPEKVWAAITNPEFTRQYWGENDHTSSDWKKGSKWKLADTKDQNRVRWVGEVLESIPPKRLVVSWVHPSNEADVSRVTYEIEPREGMICLKVIHGDFKINTDTLSQISGGWPLVLSSLKSFLETGRGIDMTASKGGTCGNSSAKGVAA